MSPERPPDEGNGWRSGHDPFVRLLRIATVVALLAIVIYLTIKSDRDAGDLSLIMGALGVVLVLLGYENLVHLPWFNRRKDED